jgi:hypothetical protein
VSPKLAGRPRSSAQSEERRPHSRGVRLRIARTPPRKPVFRIRIATLRPKVVLIIPIVRIAKPRLPTRLFPTPARGQRVVVSMVPGELRLAVVTDGDAVAPEHRFVAALPERAVTPGFGSANLKKPKALDFALNGIWNHVRLRKKRVGPVSLVISDQSVRMVAVPVAGTRLRPSEGSAMARWALRSMLPADDTEYRIDWAVLSADSLPEAHGWLFALASAGSVVREYEAALERLGLAVGRVVPASLAVAASTDRAVPGDAATARIVLCQMGGLLAALVEADGIPRFHRAWRALPRDLNRELRALDTYVRQRLDLTPVEALVAGPSDWCADAADACTAIGWHTTSVSIWSAHRGAAQ